MKYNISFRKMFLYRLKHFIMKHDIHYSALHAIIEYTQFTIVIFLQNIPDIHITTRIYIPRVNLSLLTLQSL
jgi:hypothetical protein